MAFDNPRLGSSVAETALSLGVSKATIYRAIGRGDLPAWRLGRRLIVPLAAVVRLTEPRHAIREAQVPPFPLAAAPSAGGCGAPTRGVVGAPPPKPISLVPPTQ